MKTFNLQNCLLVLTRLFTIAVNGQQPSFVLYVKPFIGIHGNGNTHPAATLPYSVVSLGLMLSTRSPHRDIVCSWEGILLALAIHEPAVRAVAADTGTFWYCRSVGKWIFSKKALQSETK